jgi:hypothetical protein
MPFIDSRDSGVQRCDLDLISAIPDRYFSCRRDPQIAERIWAPRTHVMTGREPQVPPLRCAPVGMTILLQGNAPKAVRRMAANGPTELSSRPERERRGGTCGFSSGSQADSWSPCCRNVNLGKHCFGFDFNPPLGVEQRGDHHRGCGADFTEDFAVGAADRFPIFLVGNEHTGAVHMLELRSCP